MLVNKSLLPQTLLEHGVPCARELGGLEQKTIFFLSIAGFVRPKNEFFVLSRW